MKIFRNIFLAALVFASSRDLSAQTDSATNLTLSIPGASWALDIDAPGFEIQKSGFSPDGAAAQLVAENHSTSLILSAFIEKADSEGDAKKARTFYWNRLQNNPLITGGVTMWETDSLALLEYPIKANGVIQQNMNIYLSTNGQWIDIHVSKMEYQPADEALFATVVQSVRIDGNYQTSPLQEAFWGSFYMAQSNYVTGVRCNERALALDKQHPSLGLPRRIMVMEDVINCYGNLGDNQKAKALSLDALKEHPDYPAFYYCLACAYAGLGDKTNALDCLKKAYANKAKLLSDEQLSDPRTDWSFTPYANDPAYVAFYATLK